MNMLIAGVLLLGSLTGLQPQADVRAQQRLEWYRQIREDMKKSMFRVEKNEVTTIRKRSTLQPEQVRQLELIKIAYKYVRQNKINVPEGAKIAFSNVDATTAIVIFDHEVRPPHTRGGDYSAAVKLNTKTGELIGPIGISN